MSFTGSFRALSRSNELSGIESSLVRGTLVSTAPTLTYTSIGANLTQDQTTTVSGASLGDIVLIGSPNLAAGLYAVGFVSAANTVTVRVANSTAGAIVPGALVFNVLVVKP